MRVEAGAFHSLAILNDGSVLAWGSNFQGQTTVPAFPPGTIAVQVGGGAHHSVALLNTTATLALHGTPSLGAAVGVSLDAPQHPNQPYLIALSLASSPGILLPDGRTVPLQADALFWMSTTPGNPYLLNGAGVLDGSGSALLWAVLAIPNLPALLGQTVFCAAATADAMSLSGIGAISPAYPVTIVP